MSTTVNFTIELKSLIAAGLAFGTVFALKQPQFSKFVSQFGDKQETIIIFIVLLIVQVLFEVLYKYEGKTCEVTEGIFTALAAILGYFIAGLIIEKINAATNAAAYALPPAGNQSGGYVSPVLFGAVGAAAGLWIWKRWLKAIILPSSCSPCQPISCAPCAPCPAPQVIATPPK